MLAVKQAFNQLRDLQNELQALPGIEYREAISQSESVLPYLEQIVTDKELLKAVSRLFYDGHHAQAVEKACKFLNNLVKRESGNSAADGAGLMRTIFSAKNPVLRFNAGSTQSEQDEQSGYMDIMAGVMTGIRNPRAHEHDWEDTEERALQLLCIANHLVLRVRNAEKATAPE